MKHLLVVGGDGNMTGMRANHFPDDMKGLLQALRNCAQYERIVFYPSKRFLLPPDNVNDLLPLADVSASLKVV